MAGSTESDAASGGFRMYHYDPSVAAAVLFALLFAATSIRHLQLLIRTKTWAFIPFLLGCLCTRIGFPGRRTPFTDANPPRAVETIGYAARAYSAKQTPDWTLMPYIIQSLLILLGPALFAGSIYMVLGRLIRVLDAQDYSLIRVQWLTKLFLLGDILSILGQGGGERVSPPLHPTSNKPFHVQTVAQLLGSPC